MRFGRSALLALLVATVFGLVAMHSLGHGGRHAPAAAAHHVASAPMAADDLVMWPAGEEHPDAPMWEICLAVLAGLAVVAMAGALLRVRRLPASAVAGHFYAPRPSARAPTAPVGLTMAAMSVLRI